MPRTRTTHGLTILPPQYEMRLTIPAREALYRHNANGVDRPPSVPGIPVVTLRWPPPGVVLVRAPDLDAPTGPTRPGVQTVLALRCADEPPYPGEMEADYYERGYLAPCPHIVAAGCDHGRVTDGECDDCGARCSGAPQDDHCHDAAVCDIHGDNRVPCGAALVWYEAGYVPGYRICLAGHHAMLTGDGSTARAVRR